MFSGSSSVYGRPNGNATNGNSGGGTYNKPNPGGGGAPVPGSDAWLTSAITPIRDLTPYNK